MSSVLDQDIMYLPGVGPRKKEILGKQLNITTWRDLLEYYPYKYVDRTKVYRIDELTGDMPFVQIDDETGIEQMVAYAVTLGHRAFAFVGGPPDHRAAIARRLAEQTASDDAKWNITSTPSFALDGVLLAGTSDWQTLRAQIDARM